MRNAFRILVLGATLIAFGQAKAANECGATVSLEESERFSENSPNWRFTFAVSTKCEASTGGFNYSYIIKGKDGRHIKVAPAWTAAENKTFPVTDDQSIGADAEAEQVIIDSKSIWSKKL